MDVVDVIVVVGVVVIVVVVVFVVVFVVVVSLTSKGGAIFHEDLKETLNQILEVGWRLLL